MFDPILAHIESNGEFKVVFGLKTNEYTYEGVGGCDITKADLLIFAENSMGIRSDLEQFDSRNSFSFYVDFCYKLKLISFVLDDVEKRGLWPNRIQEYNEIVEKFKV